MNIDIPELCLVLLVGATSSGKSSFARRHFLPTEVISSDYCRALLADDETDQSVTGEAFDLLHTIVGKRLKLGKLTVVDATNVQPASRKGLIALAREYHVFVAAIVFDLPERILVERHATRTGRDFGAHVIRNQRHDLGRSIRGMEREGIRFLHVLKTPEQVEAAIVTRTRLWTNRKHETGPFDIVGDIHGCFDELRELLEKLGYLVSIADEVEVTHPQGRKVVFLGDLVDRGPNIPGVIRLVRAAVKAGTGICVAGNHDVKLAKALRGRDVKLTHGLQQSLEQLEGHSVQERAEIAEFLEDLVSHYVLDGGRLVVAHAGLSEALQGRSSGRVRSFAMYGETTGETDEYGLPIRYNWAQDYRGKAMVVYGHTPVVDAEWLNNTICVDTGCVFGGKLTALRYPERELESVAARREYYAPTRPLNVAAPALTAQQRADEVLDFEDVAGKRHVRTRLGGMVRIREENAAAALEVMSRFAADPKWLIYLPPTMSPSETSDAAGLLEHPREALEYYRKQGVAHAICEEKHMGSRAVAVVCRNEAAARRRFGIEEAASGIVYTRTGRRFFLDSKLEQALVSRLAIALEDNGLWDELQSDWVCLDCEIMPWSVKALALIRGQYAAIAASGEAMLEASVQALVQADAASRPVADLLMRTQARLSSVRAYRDAYRRYCWQVNSLDDIKIAPFHVLASEHAVHVERDHLWHMNMASRVADKLPMLTQSTPFKVVDLADAASEAAAVSWWEELTARGGEGMLVKPLAFIAHSERRLLQPAIKCRGPEYLRIIYGPEYRLPENLPRLRARGLASKRGLAMREFALGIEALERFVRKEPLRQVHECVFGILALESEPIDPRL
jgi:protein phosphatase